MNATSRRCNLVRSLAVAGCAVLMTVSAAFPAAACSFVDPGPWRGDQPEVWGSKAMVEHVYAAKMAKELRMAGDLSTQIDLNCKDLPVYA